MTRLLFCLIFLAGWLNACSQLNFQYPVLRKSGQTPAHFVPEKWVVLKSAAGDLNGDGQKDMALVLQYKDSVKVTFNENGFTDTVITQPRILAILFKTIVTNSYELAEQSNSFILEHKSPAEEDPFSDMKIEKGVLQLDFTFWYSMGSWFASRASYKFRYQQRSFVLIGAEYLTYHRASGEMSTQSYNFLTRKAVLTTGMNMSGKNEKPVTQTVHLRQNKLKTFKTFIRPNTWRVIEGGDDFYI